MSKYAVKVNTRAAYRRNNIIFISIVAALSCFGLGMMIYNFIKGNVLFAISYMIAIILGFSYVFIRINTVFPTYAAADRKSLYLKNWENNFLPYATGMKLKILSEFVPAKTVIARIPIDEIDRVIIGTKSFIKRSVEPDDYFLKAVRPYETTKDFYRKKTVHNMDVFYVATYDNESFFMPVSNFDQRNMAKLLQFLQKRNPNIEFKINSRDFRRNRAEK